MKKQGVDLLKRKPILCVDFDGVIHSYTSGWHGARNIPDPPIPGAIEWLKSLIPAGDDICAFDKPYNYFFQVVIFSSRNRYFGARRAMKNYLLKHGLSKYQLEYIKFPLLKPPAFLIIDDRAIQFKGYFPGEREMKEFKPYRLSDVVLPMEIKYKFTSVYEFTRLMEEESEMSKKELDNFVKERLCEILFYNLKDKMPVRYIKDKYAGITEASTSLIIMTEEEFKEATKPKYKY